jgi:hypothetical protein
MNKWRLGLSVAALLLVASAVAVGISARGGSGGSVAAASVDSAEFVAGVTDVGRQSGQFVVVCGFSHSLGDDPIVFPGEAGMSHQHDFFGAKQVNASTTWDELYGQATTCNQKLDTASYWSPSLYVSGEQLEPLAADVYYRPGPGVDPATVVAYPPGLAMVGGNDAASEDDPQPLAVAGWGCGSLVATSVEPRSCGGTSNINLRVNFPDCWDGVRTESPDNRSHVAYSRNGSCPADQPVAIPQLSFVVHYPVTEVGDDLRLASGSVLSGHADFVNGWVQEKLEREVAYCINRAVSCGEPYEGLNQ